MRVRVGEGLNRLINLPRYRPLKINIVIFDTHNTVLSRYFLKIFGEFQRISAPGREDAVDSGPVAVDHAVRAGSAYAAAKSQEPPPEAVVCFIRLEAVQNNKAR